MTAVRVEPDRAPSDHRPILRFPGSRRATLASLLLIGIVVGGLAVGYGSHSVAAVLSGNSPWAPLASGATASSPPGSVTAPVSLLDDSNGSDDGLPPSGSGNGSGGVPSNDSTGGANGTSNSTSSNGSAAPGNSEGGDGASGAAPSSSPLDTAGPLGAVTSLSIGDAAFLAFAVLMGVGVVLTVVRARRGGAGPSAHPPARPPPAKDPRPTEPGVRR